MRVQHVLNMNWLIFFSFNILLGGYCCWVSYQIRVNKRYDLITRKHKQPFSSPELVVGQSIWFYGISGTAFILLPIVLLLIPSLRDLSLRSLIGFDLAMSIPMTIWKQIIVMKHDNNGGRVPLEEIEDGVERTRVEIMRGLDAGRTFLASAITESEGSRINAKVFGHAGKISLHLQKHANSGEAQTTQQEFKSVAELSEYLEKNTILRIGDFK